MLEVSIMESLCTHEDAPSIGKVCMSIGRVGGMLRLAMSCSRLFHYKLTCSQLPGTCFSLEEILLSDVKDLEVEPGFLGQPSLPGAGPQVQNQARSPGNMTNVYLLP